MSRGSILEEKPVEKEQDWVWGLSGLDRGQHCLEATQHGLRSNLLSPLKPSSRSGCYISLLKIKPTDELDGFVSPDDGMKQGCRGTDVLWPEQC